MEPYKYKGVAMTVVANKKTRTNVYLDTEMKQKAQEIFKQYGMGLSDAFNIFLAQSVMQRGIPFEIKIPNDETAQAIEDARVDKNMTKISLDELKKATGA
jgi:DNA-damage-inducible protein J